MQSSMYSALFGALTSEHRLDIIANNLANANTSGFKREQYTFEDTFVAYAHDNIMEPSLDLRQKKLFPPPVHLARPRIAGFKTDFSQGGLKQTGSQLDLAIQGPGFFKVQGVGGDEYYTRNGNLHKNIDGELVNSRGDRLLGVGGPVVMPEDVSIIEFGPDGQIFADNELVGQVQVVELEDPQVLEKLGHNLFRTKDGLAAVEVEPVNSQVVQGFLESSNINVVEEMVNMIETQRAFEAYGKVISETNDTDTKAIQRVGKAL
ncbi:flagellar basal-body rod protein FlgF [Oceanidesulfovibrio indonesiensis]|uniref:Flagellar basal-body rod protein FlgF n=1 Tax=Oceanidesulfovibrio indonesiensis TaxID=54767 RepID=A0A7M3MH65_9BACT|nr:flagellar basal-body rod protein FlgF [Oceanidesulfovibrio indonesiensis]TVM18831.1 flagellar basal-body rod protein FlgF [Oceanidesulfovibrio indonesiensis]